MCYFERSVLNKNVWMLNLLCFSTNPFLFLKLWTSLASILSLSDDLPLARSVPPLLLMGCSYLAFPFNGGLSQPFLTGSTLILLLYILIKWPAPCLTVLITPVSESFTHFCLPSGTFSQFYVQIAGSHLGISPELSHSAFQKTVCLKQNMESLLFLTLTPSSVFASVLTEVINVGVL